MSPHLPIRAVLFDVDGTLYDLAALKRRLVGRIPGELFRHGPLGALRRFRSLQAFRRAREAHRGNSPVPALRDLLVGRVSDSTGLDAGLVAGAIRDFMYDSDFPELQGLSPHGDREVLIELTSHGYRIGAVSEYPVPRKLVALGLGDLPWGATVDCEMVGVLKPDPAAFLRAAAELEISAAETLVVGDRKDADVAGARAAGMPCAWLRARDPGHGDGPAPDHVIDRLEDLLGLLPGVE